MSVKGSEPVFCLCLPLQLSGGTEGMHEKRNPGPLLPGAADHSQSLFTPGDVPAQAGPENPQVPSAPPGGSSSVTARVAGRSSQKASCFDPRPQGPAWFPDELLLKLLMDPGNRQRF